MCSVLAAQLVGCGFAGYRFYRHRRQVNGVHIKRIIQRHNEKHQHGEVRERGREPTPSCSAVLSGRSLWLSCIGIGRGTDARTASLLHVFVSVSQANRPLCPDSCPEDALSEQNRG